MARAPLPSALLLVLLLGLLPACGGGGLPELLGFTDEAPVDVDPRRLTFCCDDIEPGERVLVGEVRVSLQEGSGIGVGQSIQSRFTRFRRSQGPFEIEGSLTLTDGARSGTLQIYATGCPLGQASTVFLGLVRTFGGEVREAYDPIEILIERVCSRAPRVEEVTPRFGTTDGIDPRTSERQEYRVSGEDFEAKSLVMIGGSPIPPKAVAPDGSWLTFEILSLGISPVPVVSSLQVVLEGGTASNRIRFPVVAPGDVSVVAPETTVHDGQSGVEAPIYICNATSDAVSVATLDLLLSTLPGGLSARYLRRGGDTKSVPAMGLDWDYAVLANDGFTGSHDIVAFGSTSAGARTAVVPVRSGTERAISARGGRSVHDGTRTRDGGDGGRISFDQGDWFATEADDTIGIFLDVEDVPPQVTVEAPLVSTAPSDFDIDGVETFEIDVVLTKDDDAKLVIDARWTPIQSGTSGTTSSSSFQFIAAGGGNPAFDSSDGVRPGDKLVIHSGSDQGSYRVWAVTDPSSLFVEDYDGALTSFTGSTGASWSIERPGSYREHRRDAGTVQAGDDTLVASDADFGSGDDATSSGEPCDLLLIEDGPDAGTYLIVEVLANDRVRVQNLDGSPVRFSSDQTVTWSTQRVSKVRASGDVVFNGASVTREDATIPAHVCIESTQGDVVLANAAIDLGEGVLILRASNGRVIVADSTIEVQGRDTERGPAPGGGFAALGAKDAVAIQGSSKLNATGGTARTHTNGDGGTVWCHVTDPDATPVIVIGPKATIDASGGSIENPVEFGRGGSGGHIRAWTEGLGELHLQGRLKADGGNARGENGGDGGDVEVIAYLIKVDTPGLDTVIDAGGGASTVPAVQGEGDDGGNGGSIQATARGKVVMGERAAVLAIGGAGRRAGHGGDISIAYYAYYGGGPSPGVLVQGTQSVQGGLGRGLQAVAGDGGGGTPLQSNVTVDGEFIRGLSGETMGPEWPPRGSLVLWEDGKRIAAVQYVLLGDTDTARILSYTPLDPKYVGMNGMLPLSGLDLRARRLAGLALITRGMTRIGASPDAYQKEILDARGGGAFLEGSAPNAQILGGRGGRAAIIGGTTSQIDTHADVDASGGDGANAAGGDALRADEASGEPPAASLMGPRLQIGGRVHARGGDDVAAAASSGSGGTVFALSLEPGPASASGAPLGFEDDVVFDVSNGRLRLGPGVPGLVLIDLQLTGFAVDPPQNVVPDEDGIVEIIL